MTQIEAVFRHGVFEPLGPVSMSEGSRVRLKVEPSGGEDLKNWLEEVRTMHAEFLKHHAPLPDSTLGIAEDRMR